MITLEEQNKQETIVCEIANKIVDFKRETINIQLKRIWCFTISSDNQFLVVGGLSKEKQILIYQDNKTFQLLKMVHINSDLVYNLQLSSKDNYLCVGCRGQNILIWKFQDLISKQQTQCQMIQTMFRIMPKMYFSPDEKYLCYQESTTIKFWNIKDNLIEKIISRDHKILNFSIKMYNLYEVGKSNSITIIFFPKTKILKFILVDQEENQEIDVSENNFLIVNASRSKIFIINIQSGKTIRMFNTPQKAQKITLLNNGQYFSFASSAISSEDQDCIFIVEISTHKILLQYFTCFSQPAYIFKFTPLQFMFANINQIEVLQPIK